MEAPSCQMRRGPLSATPLNTRPGWPVMVQPAAVFSIAGGWTE